MGDHLSSAEILAELPQLTREQRAAVLAQLAVLDQGLWVDATNPADERKAIDWRLAEARSGAVSWSQGNEAKSRIQGKLNQD